MRFKPKSKSKASQKAFEVTDNLILGVDETTYGNDYKNHLLEQYKLYVNMSNSLSDRRAVTNRFFLTLNTILSSIAIAILETIPKWYLLVPIGVVGILISIVWFFLIKSYKQLNSAKFEVINRIERKLPATGFTAEWEIATQRRKRYKLITRFETFVPWIMIGLYVFVIIFLIISLI